MSSFSTYLIGYIIFVIGLALAAFYLNVPPIWIGIGFVVLVGIGILMATKSEKPRDPPKV
jgi:peptidoglycan/LPS O-acetylase OafA/YrhL